MSGDVRLDAVAAKPVEAIEDTMEELAVGGNEPLQLGQSNEGDACLSTIQDGYRREQQIVNNYLFMIYRSCLCTTLEDGGLDDSIR